MARAACKWLRRLAEPSVAWSGEPVWRLFPFVLALAFAVRVAVALFGDFLLHPDEVIQYLEPAHRAAFGNGIGYWEQFHGARPWLLPGFIAGLLTGFAAIGWDQPAWYVPAVNLVFCLISLGIPAGMYFFAHKPMPSFVATALLLPLLALVVKGGARGIGEPLAEPLSGDIGRRCNRLAARRVTVFRQPNPCQGIRSD